MGFAGLLFWRSQQKSDHAASISGAVADRGDAAPGERVENEITDGEDKKGRLKTGEQIDVILEAETDSKNENK